MTIVDDKFFNRCRFDSFESAVSLYCKVVQDDAKLAVERGDGFCGDI
jgi:hypothetical protein